MLKPVHFLFVVLLVPGLAHAEVRQTQSLNGTWQVVFDSDNQGRAAGWFREASFLRQSRRDIAVPSCWETIEKDYEGVAFYGRRFSVPEAWQRKTVRLEFDAVNYIAEVYLNDHVVGRHEGGYGPFEFRVDDLLKYGEENFVSLRVLGPLVAQDKVIDGIGWNDVPHWRGAITGGIWQSVRLVATGTALVEDVFLEPRLADDSVTAHMTVRNADHVSRKVNVAVSIRSTDGPDRVVAEKSVVLDLVPGETRKSVTLTIPDPRHWSPDDPHLYTATMEVAEAGSVLDSEDVRFGMRELTIHNNRFELNGNPIYIKAAFFEGLYPTNLALPDSLEMARREIVLAKECGFNMIRPWRKPPPPEWLDLCDELGMLVVGGMPIECMRFWPAVTPHIRDRIETEVRSAVLRDRNRACVVQWEIFNEIKREDLERLKHSMSMLARRLDPTRLILDESGGFAGGSAIYLPYELEPVLFNDVHSYPGAPMGDAKYDSFLTLSKTNEEILAMGLPIPKQFSLSVIKPGLLTYVSEIGYGSLPDLVDNNARFAESGNPLVPPYRYHRKLAESYRAVLKQSGLDAVYPDLKQFCLDQQEIHSQANKRMIESIRSNSSTCGYAVHALTGGDWVVGAGLLDLFRNPKGSYWGTQEANQDRYLAVRVQPRNIYASRGSRLTITGINDQENAAGKLAVEVLAADGAVVFTAKQDAELVSGISSLLDIRLNTKEMAGTYTVRATLVGEDGSVLTRNSVEIDVFRAEQLAAPKAKIAVLDVDGSLCPYLDASRIPFGQFDANTPTALPVFVSKSAAPSPQARARFASLHAFVKRGGTAVYLESIPRLENIYRGARLPSKEVLPIDARLKTVMGLWVGVAHVVTNHPVFDGLPQGCMMGQVYENVWATHALVNTGGEVVVGSVTHSGFPNQGHIPNYLGPDDAWFGMDLGVVPRGEGRYVLSSLRIVENLGKDPVADRLLNNLIKWTAR